MDIKVIQDELNQFKHHALIEQWASCSGFVEINLETLVVRFPFHHLDLINSFQAWWQSQTPLNQTFKLDIQPQVKPLQTKQNSQINGVKNIIAVSSGKGGVGKSMVTFNLALALQQQGAKVGILDADIYGPSLPVMSNTQDQSPQIIADKWMNPVEAYGLALNSIGYLVDKNDATIWRGPMASKALMQLLNETRWPDLDYLIVDMPPGTGDIQLTLAQQIPVTSAIIVTTPQDLALADVTKGINMFDRVQVPVLGVVENMSYHQCEKCGHQAYLFGQQGAEKLAKQHALGILARIPLHMAYSHINSSRTKGIDTTELENTQSFIESLSAPDQQQAQVFVDLAQQVASRMYWQGDEKVENISIINLS